MDTHQICTDVPCEMASSFCLFSLLRLVVSDWLAFTHRKIKMKKTSVTVEVT